MKITINSINIKNFKGCTSLHLDFTENKNILEGENGIGKTTVLDAITWCLFGKNFADEKQFKIKPIIDNEEKTDLVTSVELNLNDISIERIWDKDTTTIKVDGTKFGSREFSDYLRDKFLITDSEFKALSNIDYIPSLHWKDLRTLIMGLVGEITNEEVYEKVDVSLIKDKIESVGIEKTADDIKESKSSLNNEIKRMQGNIDQKNSDIQELVINDDEVEELTAHKEQVKKQIENYNLLKEKKSNQDEDIRKLDKLKEDLIANDLEQQRLRADNVEYQKTYEASNIDIKIVRENKIKEIKNKIENVNKDLNDKREDKTKEINKLDLEKITLIAERTNLKNKYDEEIKREIKVENSTCSACGQSLPETKIQETLAKLKEESVARANKYVLEAKEKLNRINEIDTSISAYKSEINQLEEQADKETKKLQEEIKIAETEEIDSTQESDIQKQMKKNMENNGSKISNLIDEQEVIKKSIKFYEEKINNHEVIDLKDISEMQNELEEITKKLAASEVLNNFKSQLKELERQYQDLIAEKEQLNEKEQQLIAFNNTRAEMLRNKVKHEFKMADFIVQETTKDGKLIETFKIAIDGIEYNALNTGHKILVALDLIDNIQRMKDKRLPILIDGLGELTRLPNLDTQIIGCRAKYQANKKLEVSNV